MRKPPRLLGLATALAALGVPAAAAPTADSADSDGAQIHTEAEKGIQAKAKIRPPGDVELMSFTVHPGGDGIPAHSSHSSHSSHASHASHASSSPGIGLPYVPDPIYVPPIAPAPIYAPPVVQSPAPTNSPPSGSTVDPRYVACTGASNGLGVNDIASQLSQGFGMSGSDAVSMAQQALTAVLTGGHYCDGYLGNHE